MAVSFANRVKIQTRHRANDSVYVLETLVQFETEMVHFVTFAQ